MNLIDQLTTPETSRALIALGMPVPEPAIGQVWYGGGRRFMICPNGSDCTTWTDIDDGDPFHINDLNMKSHYTPMFTAPEIMAWADMLDNLALKCIQAGRMWVGYTDGVGFYHENPAEAIAQAVIAQAVLKAMKDEQ